MGDRGRKKLFPESKKNVLLCSNKIVYAYKLLQMGNVVSPHTLIKKRGIV